MNRLYNLVNQENNRKLLLNTIHNGHIANAYLFHGPEGSGQEGFALEYAAMLNCHARENQPCGECPSCHKMKTLEHGNIHLVFPIQTGHLTKDDPPFKNFGPDDMEEVQNCIKKKAANPYEKLCPFDGKHIPINFIREIRKKIYLTAPESGYKVVIVFDADLMLEPAVNAFLKILEEPPEKTTLILTTSNLNALLPTIRSRCQTLYFPALSTTELGNHLRENGIREDQINLVMRLSGGDVRQAIQLKEADLGRLRKITLETLRMVATWKIDKVYDLVNQFVMLRKENPDEFDRLMYSISFWFRDAAILKAGKPESELVHADMQTELRKFVDYYTELDAFGAYSAVDNCIDLTSRNVYINLALVNMFFKIHNRIQPGKSQ